MSNSYDVAERLFNRGEFEALTRSTDLSDRGLRATDAASKLLAAHALALMGAAETAKQPVASFNQSMTRTVRRRNGHEGN
jgi:hypothetical protein